MGSIKDGDGFGRGGEEDGVGDELEGDGGGGGRGEGDVGEEERGDLAGLEADLWEGGAGAGKRDGDVVVDEHGGRVGKAVCDTNVEAVGMVSESGEVVINKESKVLVPNGVFRE